MKRNLICMLLLTGVLLLTGCGKSEARSAEITTTTEQSEETTEQSETEVATKDNTSPLPELPETTGCEEVNIYTALYDTVNCYIDDVMIDFTNTTFDEVFANKVSLANIVSNEDENVILQDGDMAPAGFVGTGQMNDTCWYMLYNPTDGELPLRQCVVVRFSVDETAPVNVTFTGGIGIGSHKDDILKIVPNTCNLDFNGGRTITMHAGLQHCDGSDAYSIFPEAMLFITGTEGDGIVKRIVV